MYEECIKAYARFWLTVSQWVHNWILWLKFWFRLEKYKCNLVSCVNFRFRFSLDFSYFAVIINDDTTEINESFQTMKSHKLTLRLKVIISMKYTKSFTFIKFAIYENMNKRLYQRFQDTKRFEILFLHNKIISS
jgi:hypothetical protein